MIHLHTIIKSLNQSEELSQDNENYTILHFAIWIIIVFRF